MIATLFRMYKLRRYTKWNIGDTLLEVKEKDEDQEDPLDSKSEDKYTCFRNINGYCIYLKSNQVDEFLKMNSIYSKELNIINVSEIRKYIVYRNARGEVYDKINPHEVKVKFIGTFKIDNVEGYLVNTVDLDSSYDLYRDLVNYNKIERKYN